MPLLHNMNITLYKNLSPSNKVTKNLVSKKDLGDACALILDTSVVQPNITVGGFKKASDFTDYNYCYISQFNRYFFINEITACKNGYVKMTLECDVLMSFKTDILNSTQLVTRQKNKGKMYLADAEWAVDGRTYLRSQYFNENHFDTQNDAFVLITV